MSIQFSDVKTHTTAKAKKFNVDLLAITIALTLAALIRLNIIPHISF
ncbi:hypothetical protein [Granulicella sibirica]|uniref:Uncharacterized protein n=1 Tax=Granulicella sibirica TaxID=2479048 RepID=A0A4Q0T0X0_9BACT|nr:hypothetical protein [Granulicella sibirica]RXH55151.1 hypothetical protein GRAN_4255 [Granulicella sibirica]